MTSQSWKIKQIQEADYGCEERLPGEETKVIATLEHDSGKASQTVVPDEWLYENGIEEGNQIDDEFYDRYFHEV